MDEYLLEIDQVSKHFKIGSMLLGKKIMAVDHVSVQLPKSTSWIMSIVGESGSGKTTLARMILGLAEPSEGKILIDGKPVGSYRHGELYQLVQPIFQNPFSAFNSRTTVERLLFETAINIGKCNGRNEAERLIDKTLHSVGLSYEQIKGKYPNQFSGGELQRISIARALIPNPKLIVADEPVAMIDASLRMNIVNLFKKLRDEYHVNFIYVTHDLSTAYYVSDYIATMYQGNIIESGDARKILGKPLHPYTELLLDSIPKVGDRWDKNIKMPDWETMNYWEQGCRFAGRCKYAMPVCMKKTPSSTQVVNNHFVFCHKFNNEEYKEQLVPLTNKQI